MCSTKKKGPQAKLRHRIKQLKYLLRSHTPLHIKKLLYTAIIRPIWTYGGSIWGSASKTNINKIQILQNRILRIMTAAPWYVRNDTYYTTYRPIPITRLRHNTENIFHAIWHLPASHQPAHHNHPKQSSPTTTREKAKKKKHHTDLRNWFLHCRTVTGQ
jgi:hypothetical protein